MMRTKIFYAISVVWLSFAVVFAGPVQSPDKNRLIVFISDLHWGLGCKDGGGCEPTEDFRWRKAFQTFLDYASEEGENQVDLVINGDLLELWQPPADHTSAPRPDKNMGFTLEEAKAMVSLVTEAHEKDFKALCKFALKGGNRVYIIPGNHDAALLAPEVWEHLIAKGLASAKDRIELVKNGIWSSPDGYVVAEHGHQIDGDLNKFKDFGNIFIKHGDNTYIECSYGERFVQKLFNEEEREYPIIDNFIPESAGARFRMAERGLWGTAQDIAQFIRFNLFETSYSQLVTMGGKECEGAECKAKFVRKIANDQGYKLFTRALKKEDAFRKLLEKEPADEQVKKVRQQLDILLRQLDDEEVQKLCDMVEAVEGENPCLYSPLGLTKNLARRMLPQTAIFRKHLSERIKSLPKMRLFVYGHTHEYETPWQVTVDGGIEITVVNSGAFQRLIREDQFRDLVNKSSAPEEIVKNTTPEQLPPCYSVVFFQYVDGKPKYELRMWRVRESGEPEEKLTPSCNRNLVFPASCGCP